MLETQQWYCRYDHWPADMKRVSVPDQIPESIAHRLDETRSKNARVHFAVMNEPYLGALLSGDKTIESRFSRNRIDPWMRVGQNDLVLIARSGGVIAGSFFVDDAMYFDLSIHRVSRLQNYSNQICSWLSPTFWEDRADARFATLLAVSDVETCQAFRLRKRDQRAWITFDWPEGLF